MYDALKQKDPNQNLSNKPKPYLNFASFDDQFNLVDDNSGVRQVQGDANVLQALSINKSLTFPASSLRITFNTESSVKGTKRKVFRIFHGEEQLVAVFPYTDRWDLEELEKIQAAINE